ncbi:HAD-IA family hydrolase [Ideonella sp. YS5]|uniref:HAD-IA family hydrolase n=1 Tax=Ideonella sp. YS5 TaxID=3453714 RepID=UPI003EEF62F5
MDIDIISFDLDGTLVDTAGEIAEAANRALESHGIARRPEGEITRFIGAGTKELMLRVLARVFMEQPGLADRVRPQEVLESLDRHYEATTGTTSTPYPGAVDLLARLKAEGVLLACTTNKELRHVRRLLDKQGMEHCFDLVVAGDSLPVKKPDAGVLRHVVATLRGDARRTAHLGDSHTDVMAARNAGVEAWAVPYGYNAGEPIEASRPDHVFASLHAVTAHVFAQRPTSRERPSAEAGVRP